MPLFPITKDEIFMRQIRKLNAETNITQNTPGGKARFFLDAISNEQGQQYSFFNENIVQAYLQYATGKFLDFWGDLFQIPRIESINAESTEDNFMFYVDSGTFGDINDGASFFVPAGQKVFPKEYTGTLVTPNVASRTIYFSTAIGISCEADQSFAFVKVRADIEGRNGNIPKGILINHNFTEYSSSSSSPLKCINRFSIDNGDERESDGAYRYRLMEAYRAKHKAVSAALRLAAYSVPGVSNLYMITAEQGPGTVSLYIKSTTPTTSPRLLAKVATAVEAVVGEGIRPFILPPRPIGVELIVGVNWSPRATEEDKSSQKNAIKEEAQSFFKNIDIGQSLSLDDLFFAMLKAAPSVLSFGKAVPNKFEEVYLYRSISNGTGYIRSRLTTNVISPLYNERIILETSGRDNGITII